MSPEILPLFPTRPESKYSVSGVVSKIFQSFTLIYGLFSVIGIIIASVLYNNICNDGLALIIILESVISIIIILYIFRTIYISYDEGFSICIMLTSGSASFTFILIGNLLIWPYNNKQTCPSTLYQFAFLYFNLWWITAIIGLITIGIICVIMQNKFAK